MATPAAEVLHTVCAPLPLDMHASNHPWWCSCMRWCRDIQTAFKTTQSDHTRSLGELEDKLEVKGGKGRAVQGG